MVGKEELLERITARAGIFGDRPIIRDMRVATEHVLGHVLGMLAAGNTAETILREHPGLKPEDILASLPPARRSLAGGHAHERVKAQGPHEVSPRFVRRLPGAA